MARQDTVANPFASIAPQSTKADDYNFFKGVVADAGGLIKGFQDKEEANKLANFNNALLDMTNKGDTEGLKQLAGYSDQFKDATTKQKAFADASGAFDTTATTKVLTSADQAKQRGDLEAYNNAISSASVLSPKSQATIQAKANVDLPELVAGTIYKGSLNLLDQQQNEADAVNKNAFNAAFAANPAYSKFFNNVNGRIVPLEVAPELRAQQTLLENQLNLDAVNKGAKSTFGALDNAEKQFKANLRANNVPEAKITELTKAFIAQASEKSELGPQGKAEEAKQHAIITADTAFKLAQVKDVYGLTTKFNEAEQKDLIESVTFKQNDLIDHINKNFDNTTWYSTKDGRDEIKEKLDGVLKTKINGRVPSPFEVKQALDLLSTNPLFRSARVADMDLINKTLAGIMTTGVVGRAEVLKIPKEDIKKYYDEVRNIQTQDTVQKLRATSAIKGGVGIRDNASYGLLNSRPATETSKASTTTPTPTQRPNIRPNLAAEAVTGLTDAKIPKNNVGNLKDAKTGEIRTFNTPEEGVAAVKAQLTRYMEKGSPINGEKITNIKGIIDNWRPASDTKGNPKFISQDNYYKVVSDILGVGINDPIKPTETTLNRLVEAIAKVEHGKNIKVGS
jgi:hypothetical protein